MIYFDYCPEPMEEPGYVEECVYEQVVENFVIACVDVFIYNPEDSTYFVVLRGQEPAKGIWWLPGGRVNKGESFHDTARRKCAREVGIKNITLEEKIFGPYATLFPTSAWGCPTHTINSVALAILRSEDTPQLDPNHKEWKWVPIEVAPEDPYVRKVWEDICGYLDSN